MKKSIGRLIILIFALALTACSKKESEKETYVVEKLFADDLLYTGTLTTWLNGTDFYQLLPDKLIKIDLNSGETTEAPLQFGDREVIHRVQNYVDDKGIVHILCKRRENESEEYRTYLCTFDPTGELISEYDCTETMEKVDYHPELRSSFIGILPDGRVWFCCRDYQDGGKQWQILMSDKAEILLEEKKEIGVETCNLGKDGHILIYTHENGVFEVDADTGEWNPVAEKFRDDQLSDFLEGEEDEEVYYYRTWDSIRKYDRKTNKIHTVVLFDDVSILPGDVGYTLRLKNGDIVFASMKTREYFNFCKLRKQKEGEIIAEKKELTLAFVGIKGMYDKEVYAYNASQDKVQVKMKVYEDIDSMITDVMAGNVPDVIDVGDAVIYRAMEKQGLLEDLNLYFEKDSQLSREDFLECSLQYYGKEGKLYAIPYSLEIRGMMVNREAFEGITTWNRKEFEAFIDSLPEPERVTEGCTRNEMFYHLCMEYLDHFVDAENQTCDFLSEEFLEIMRCAKRFSPMSEEPENYELMREKIIDEKMILTTLRIQRVNFDYAFTRTLFQKNGRLIGFPSERGSGFLVTALPLGLAITSPGQNREEAWDFVKFVMTHERENFNYMDFLSYKPLFEEHMKKLYDAAKEETPIAQIPIGELQLDVAPATVAEIDEIQRILNQGEVINPMDYQILDIIDEEADSYFSGAKTEKQAAEVIQNRVQLYLSE